MNNEFPKLLIDKFVCDKYMFKLYGDNIDDIVYKVTYTSYNKIDPIRFYNDIMYNEKINFYLGIYLGAIIIDKQAYIKINGDDSIYMVLKLKTLEISSYYEIINSSASVKNMEDSFNEVIICKYKYPVATSINEIEVSDNSFCNKYHVTINILNVNDRDIDHIMGHLYSQVIYNVGENIKTKIKNKSFLNIGLTYKFITIHGYRSIKLVGFAIPTTIEKTNILSLTEDSIILEDSDNWNLSMNNTEKNNISNIIPCIYNTKNQLYCPIDIIKKNNLYIKGNKYVEINFSTIILSLNDNLMDIDFDIIDRTGLTVIHFVPYNFIKKDNKEIKLYKNLDKHSEISYCGYIDHGVEKELFEYIRDDKCLKKSYIEFFYNNREGIYFLIRKSSFSNYLYNLIKSKLHRGK